MNFIHTIARMMATYMLRVFLIVLPLFIALAAIFSSPTFVETALHKGGVYDHFVEAVMTQSAKQTKDTDTQNLLNDPGVRNVVGQSITPQILQSASEDVIDGFYAWLQGKTTDIQFSIDLTEPQQKLQANLKAYALSRAQSLPTCTIEQLKQLSTQPTQDILHITCLPPGLNIQQAAEQFSTNTLTSADFLTNTKITSADLQKNTNAGSFATQNAWMPALYHWITVAPWAIGVMCLLTAAGTFFAYGRGRRALKVIGWSMLGVGIFWLVTIGLYAFAAHRLAEIGPTTSGGVLDGPLMNTLLDLLRELVVRIGIVSMIYSALAIVMLIVVRKYPQKTQQETTQTATAAAAPISAKPEHQSEPPKEQ